MKLNYSPKDWQLLSSYLDGQLTNREVSIVETRLHSEPQLKLTLMEMQQTRYLLQHAKKIPVPRSFTLTPEMAVQIRPARKPLFPFFSFASVIATIFLVVVILFEFLPGMLSGAMSPKSEASNEMLAMEAAPMAADAMDSADSPQIFEWGYPQAKIEGGYGGGGDMGAGMLAVPPIGGGAEIEPLVPEMPAEEPVPALEEDRTLMKQADAEPVTDAGPILGIRSAEETDAFNNSVLNILRESGKEPIPTFDEPFPWLRISQILLGGIAIITAITAIILRKRSF
ncbi:MAG: hypothetical protein CVU41_06355 [Chloroflexi bacterium HGW-Chloroflexi-3]|nr:MAG: hypothetical protein CVU41_06355 [Chloroflexi bacterium HGW-Chloroflexi-3]